MVSIPIDTDYTSVAANQQTNICIFADIFLKGNRFTEIILGLPDCLGVMVSVLASGAEGLGFWVKPKTLKIKKKLLSLACSIKK